VRERQSHTGIPGDPDVSVDSEPKCQPRTSERSEVDADAVIASLVHRGSVTHAALRAAGVSEGAVRHRLRKKRLHIAWDGVYFVGHSDPPRFGREWAALQVGGDKARLFYRTAAVAWAFLPPQVDRTIHLALNAQRRDRKGLKFHQVDLPRDEWRTIHGDIRITTPARTLLDNADHPNLENMVADAIRRELTTREELEALLERHKGERGTRRLREILDVGPLWSASALERRLIDLLRKAELPLPESNLLVGRTKPDLVWREQRVLVELDSRGFHNDWIAGRTDRAKDRARTLQGWTVLRYTAKDLRDHPFRVIAEIAAALARTQR
jgi:very-short-patch-repair endonuclease